MQKDLLSIANDGTSQAGRKLKALDPDYVAVDERSTEDLLAFIRKYAKELSYFNERNEADGDWSAFLGYNEADDDWSAFLEEIAAYVSDPQQFDSDPDKKERFSRPHLTLFLTFLELLKIARQQLNDLTRRHLEFYYREALRLTYRTGQPDKVHVLVELSDNQDEFLLPSGTGFQAGKDALDQPILFRSDEDLLVNRASLGSVKTLFTAMKRIGIAEARKEPKALIDLPTNDKNVFRSETAENIAFLAMVMMALGDPTGTTMAKYPDGSTNGCTVNGTLLNELDAILSFVTDTLYMSFSDFRTLVALKKEQDNANWSSVNTYLNYVGQGQRNNNTFTLNPSKPANFEQNLLDALGLDTFDNFFATLRGVEDIYDVYRLRSYVATFINKSLHFKSTTDFANMMDIVEGYNGRWRRIYKILRFAGLKKQYAVQGHTLNPVQIRTYDADKFNTFIINTLGTITYPNFRGNPLSTVEACLDNIIKLENYFQMSAENFAFARKVNADPGKYHPWELEKVYDIMAEAHRAKARSIRRNALTGKTINAMILFALGDPNPGDPLPSLKTFDNLDPVKDKDYLVNKLFLEPANFSYILNIKNKINATDTEKANVSAILESAQCRKRNWTESPAEIEKWENIYAAPDATQVLVQPNVGGEEDIPRWFTFGKGYSANDKTACTEPGDIGFAIASPLLALAEGKRTITLTVGFGEKNFDTTAIDAAISVNSPFPFRALLSTEKEMTAVKQVTTTRLTTATNIPGAASTYQRALQFTISLDEQAPAIAPLRTSSGVLSPWPVLQIMLADLPPEEGALKRYAAFKSLVLEKIHIKTEVNGLAGLTLQNDNSFLDPKQPFEPFGFSPVVGSSFYFAHAELCSKKLDKLNFRFEWLAAPDNFQTYYLGYLKSDERDTDPITGATTITTTDPNTGTKTVKATTYDPTTGKTTITTTITPTTGAPTTSSTTTTGAPTSPITDNAAFKASLKLYDNRSFFPADNTTGSTTVSATGSTTTGNIIPLFNAVQGNPIVGASKVNACGTTLNWLDTDQHPYERELQPVTGREVLDWNRYWRLELLSPDFQHSVYPKVAAGCANKIDSNGKPKPYIVNPPYTPMIKRLTIDYSASLELFMANDSFAGQADRLYHIEPFGYRDISCYKSRSYTFLPHYENEGELFIGIKNLKPPQSLTLLFQMDDGSADPDLNREPVYWSYLDNDDWLSLEEGCLVSDATNGLLNSGVIQFNLQPAQPGNLLPANQYWLRATIERNCRSVANIVAIHTQAVSAVFEDRNNDPDRTALPLPAGSITGLAEILPQVKAIHQPYSSFGGKSPEQAGSFYTRVSDRLRHKNRALTCWDYEHMVLEAFPGIYKVKCLPAGTSEDPKLADVIQVVVIPDIRGKLHLDPFEPKPPADLLLQIEQYLAKCSHALARIQVKPPTFVQLRIRLGVRLRSDGNPGYFKKLLNEELKRFLSPWAYDKRAEVYFNKSIHSSMIINIVEKLPYVDYVANMTLFTSPDGHDFTAYDASPDTQLEEVTVFAADVILVSARSHVIDLITEEGYEPEFFSGINYMAIELDFKVAEDQSIEQAS